MLPVVRAAIFAGAFCGLVCNSAQVQEATAELPAAVRTQIDGLAARVAALLRRPGVNPSAPKVLVADFVDAKSKHISRLGVLLADQFSASLARLGNGFEVLDRKPIREFLRQNWMQPDDFRDQDACLWIARQLGASGAVRGEFREESGGAVRLSLHIEGLGTTLYSDELLPLTEAMRKMLAEDLPPIDPQPDSIPSEPGIFSAGEDGISTPACVDCPHPDYTSIARLLKYQGSVVLSVVIGTDGKPTAIRVVKGAPYGLTKQAIDVLPRWRLTPAQKNGKPVPVRVSVEIAFHLFE